MGIPQGYKALPRQRRPGFSADGVWDRCCQDSGDVREDPEGMGWVRGFSVPVGFGSRDLSREGNSTVTSLLCKH